MSGKKNRSQLKFKVSGLSGKWLTPSFFPENRPTTPGVDEYSSAIVIKVKVKNLIPTWFIQHDNVANMAQSHQVRPWFNVIYILFSAVQKVVKYKKNFAISLYRYWYQCWRPNKSRWTELKWSNTNRTKKAHYYVWSN